MIPSILCCLASAAVADQFGDFTYLDTGTSITITGYPTTAVGAVVIPDKITVLDTTVDPQVLVDRPVTAIGDNAFFNCATLTSVTIPLSVTSIGNNAFYYCSGLTSVTIPTSISSIGNYAFYSCSGLTGVTIPTGITSIATYAFYNCKGLTNLAIPSNVTSIGFGAFSTCTGLKSVVIPSSVTSIGNNAFLSCSGLTSVTIPTSVTSIGTAAFYQCSALTSVVIPSSVTSIGISLFERYFGLTSVTIPSSVTSIGNSAFRTCIALSQATFTGDAPTMGINVFQTTASNFTVYYSPVATGFTSPTWMGYPALQIGSASPITTWLISKGLPSNSNLLSDANGDGVSLLMAYALNLDPNLNLSGSLPQTVIGANQMSLSFYAGTAGVSYVVQTSTASQAWTTVGVTLSAPNANQIRTATVNMTDVKRFMRLVVSN